MRSGEARHADNIRAGLRYVANADAINRKRRERYASDAEYRARRIAESKRRKPA